MIKINEKGGILYPSVSIIVPTYEEALNIPILIERVDKVRQKYNLKLEMLIMDDNSQDGTQKLFEMFDEDWVHLYVRKTERGLSLAVSEGLDKANHEMLVVMDADLSHPPEMIPIFLEELQNGFDFVIGSRYVVGGSTSDDWGFIRWLNSRVATLLALPFTSVKDPMSGFFALTKDTFKKAKYLDPVGYKIGLEIIVKCNCEKIKEIPIHFQNRKYGESKLTLKEQLSYLKHIKRLLNYKYGNWSYLAQFLTVGGLGVLVNLAVLMVLLSVGLHVKVAVGFAIFVSLVFNFVLNRYITFSYAKTEPVFKQFLGFTGACTVGAVVNYFTTIGVLRAFPVLIPQVAALIGIVAGSMLNFLFNRFGVFKKVHYRKYPSAY